MIQSLREMSSVSASCFSRSLPSFVTMASFRRCFWCPFVVGIRFYSSSNKPTVFRGNKIWEVRQEVDGKVIPDDDVERALPKLAYNIPVDIVLDLSKKWDTSWKGIKDLIRRVNLVGLYRDQRFIPERLSILGPDLAAAHFVVARGGGVRFVGQEKWIRRDDKGEYVLPRKYVPGVTIEALDLQGFQIIYEGMVNLVNLRDLRWLSFRGCVDFDDWFCDWLGRYSDTLEYLDIGGCKEVTERGIGALHRLRNLRTLVLDDLPNFNHRKLVCLMLNDVVPGCKIVGVDGIVDLHFPQLPKPESKVNDELQSETVVKISS